MSAEEALEYGLIDEIVQPNSEKIAQLALPAPGLVPDTRPEMEKKLGDYEFGKIVSMITIRHRDGKDMMKYK